MMFLVFPQHMEFYGKKYYSIRILKIGGEDRKMECEFLPDMGEISVVLCLERARYLVASNFEGHIKSFRLVGNKVLKMEVESEWELMVNGLTILRENMTNRCLIAGTEEGEVFILNWKKKKIMQKIKYEFPIHWICERNFQDKKVQLLISGPEPSKAEMWPVYDRTYKIGYEQPDEMLIEDNPYLRITNLDGNEEDIDSEKGREFQTRMVFKRRNIPNLPQKPPTLQEILE